MAPTDAQIAQALTDAAAYAATCPSPDGDITWIDEDFSDPPIYTPRRADWNDPVNGIPANLRAYELTDGLRSIADTPVPINWWLDVKSNGAPLCKFPPDAPEPATGVLPWMTDPGTGLPVRPYSQLYYQKPGATFFNAVCFRCHGTHADADTDLAKTLSALSDGQIRVANLHDGLVGKAGANASTFDVRQADGTTRNLAANYLVWMASGGTLVTFPDGLGAYLGDQISGHGGNMLGLVRTAFCEELLPGTKTPRDPSQTDYAMVYSVCTYNNPITPDIIDGSPAAGAWLDRATWNAGMAIFRYLLVDAAVDNWPLGQSDCQKVYPAN